MLEKSIAETKKVNPDRETNPVQSLSDYYNFIDKASRSLPHELLSQDTLKALSSSTASDQMLQSLFYFYFLVDQYLPQLEDKGLYKPRLQYYEPFASWLGKFSRAWGAFLDTEESWNEKIYQQLYNDPSIGLQKGWYESPVNWKTFNQFFSRRLKSPDMRPVTSPDDWAVVVSPADSVPQGTWEIDENSNIKVKEGVKTKIVTIYHVKDLLSEDSQYKDAFANGVLTHTFLSVFDYHRYHFAVGGLVREMKAITKNLSLETDWDPDNSRYLCHDSTGWQFYHTHGYVIVDTGNAGYGLVALVPMGMAQVSSVNFEPDVKVG
ncbi:MAG: phosphatidylserine decarboxylase, partial [Chloroflexi bacterium]|nr:phosphatidylserine decarboxylase [Chloroflexota bacterium]